MIGMSRLGVFVATTTRSAVDAFVQRELSGLTSMQDSYQAAHSGKFWQGLPTHAAAPTHTDSEITSPAPDQLTTKPADVAEDWQTQMPSWASAAMPGRVRIDVYDGPQGKGWVLATEASRNGRIWQRSINVGPETWRELAWREAPLSGTP